MNYNRPNNKSTNVDNRNYDAEARNLLKEVKGNQIYSLYELVTDQLKKSASDERRRELEAVKKAIQKTPNIDMARLAKVTKGYGSSMAADARAVDGNTKIQRKKG
jgi:hypothetical protein|tara:strand:+ start:383 stop:697 length:315 start_codon:yes stop_codon:yes gene_type:complete